MGGTEGVPEGGRKEGREEKGWGRVKMEVSGQEEMTGR